MPRKSFAELHRRTQEALKDGSAVNPLTVTVNSKNQSGFLSEISARHHTIISDQPHGFEGTNKGPKPSELLLAALAACQEVTWRIYADTMGIQIDRISIELRGTQDLRGFMGVDDSIPAGFVKIEGDVSIDSPATSEQLAKLQKIVDAHCPVMDDLKRSVPMSLKLV
tara:strand:- start:81 stop:581 length:501 start_codon:yes stop_codon:yes gene_type:complete